MDVRLKGEVDGIALLAQSGSASSLG